MGNRIGEAIRGRNGDHDISAAVLYHSLAAFPGIDFNRYPNAEALIEYFDYDIVKKPAEFIILGLKVGGWIVGEHPFDDILGGRIYGDTKQQYNDDAKRSHVVSVASLIPRSNLESLTLE